MIVVQLTGICHCNCAYCLDEFKNTKPQKVEKIKEMIPKIEDKFVLITGGEVLLIEEINDIIDEFYKHDKVITLHTEGSLINKLPPETLKKISCISLPLDSLLTNENKKLGRFTNQYDICIDAINYVETYTKVRVSSVITKQNQLGILELAHFLKTKNIEWRVYELEKKGNAIDNFETLYLKKTEVKKIQEKIKNIHDNVKIMEIKNDYDDYFYITPELNLVHFTEGGYNFIKNMQKV